MDEEAPQPESPPAGIADATPSRQSRWMSRLGRLRGPIVAIAAGGTVIGGLAGYWNGWRTVHTSLAEGTASTTKATGPVVPFSAADRRMTFAVLPFQAPTRRCRRRAPGAGRVRGNAGRAGSQYPVGACRAAPARRGAVGTTADLEPARAGARRAFPLPRQRDAQQHRLRARPRGHRRRHRAGARTAHDQGGCRRRRAAATGPGHPRHDPLADLFRARAGGGPRTRQAGRAAGRARPGLSREGRLEQ